MNATVIFSYAFIYFVLFLVVPLVIVTFVMTCIKFFRTSGNTMAEAQISIKPHLLDQQSMQFIKSLKSITQDRYDVLYGASLTNVVDIDQAVKNQDEVQNFMDHCHLDYVVVDNKSSSVKLVISNPEESSPEQMQFIKKCLGYIGVQYIKLDKEQRCNESLIKTALAA